MDLSKLAFLALPWLAAGALGLWAYDSHADRLRAQGRAELLADSLEVFEARADSLRKVAEAQDSAARVEIDRLQLTIDSIQNHTTATDSIIEIIREVAPPELLSQVEALESSLQLERQSHAKKVGALYGIIEAQESQLSARSLAWAAERVALTTRISVLEAQEEASPNRLLWSLGGYIIGRIVENQIR